MGDRTEDLTTEASSFSSEGATYEMDASSYNTLPHGDKHVDDMGNDIRYLIL